MTESLCIFNYNDQECSHGNDKHMNIEHLACQTHLKELYGLELEHYLFETPMSYAFVGGFLKPVAGVYFEENTVIFPTRKFFDQHFNMLQKHPDNSDGYIMNPVIEQFMHNLANRRKVLPSQRYTIEALRNLQVPTDDINLGPQQDAEKVKSKAISLMQSKRTICETRIKLEQFYEYVDMNKLFDKSGKEITFPTDTDSIAYKYLINKCLFSHNYNQSKDHIAEFDTLRYNASYVKDVGLVASEDIGNPVPIVVYGVDLCTNPFLDETVNEVPKQVMSKKVSLRDIPSNYAKKGITRGSDDPNCFFG